MTDDQYHLALEVQLKTTVRNHLTAIRMTVTKTRKQNKTKPRNQKISVGRV